MSRVVYDNWGKLVGAVVRREKDRQLAYCESFSSSYSADVSSRFSFDPLVGDVHVPPVVLELEYEEIRKATRHFGPEMFEREDRSGRVYKGWMNEHYLTAAKPGSGIAVAVKMLNNDGKLLIEWLVGISSPKFLWWNVLTSLQNLLQDHINYLGQLRHPNLVKLIGYSFVTYERILVYESMSKGALDNHLFTRRRQSLPWAARIKVAVGAARALAFLHGLEIPIIFGCVRSHDILLDADFNAKLRDFGLARDHSMLAYFDFEIEGPFGVINQVEATYGPCAAPEYIATGRSSTECDVYSYGVVLLELISGLRAFDRSRRMVQHNLMNWAKPYLRDEIRLSQIMDSRLEGQYSLKEAYRVGKIALQCISSDPSSRPRMDEVVAALQLL